MANESGTTSAPQTKAAEKSSGNVMGAQAVQMLVKRQAEAATATPSAEHAEPAPDKTEKPTASKTVPSEETQPATPPETAEKPETEQVPETEQPPPDEVLSKLSPEQKERIEKRIGKEVAKRKVLEEEINRLKVLASATQAQPVPAFKAPVIEPTADNPLANVTSEAELDKQKQLALETKDWAQEQLDREDFTEVKVNGLTYGKTELKQVIRNSDKLISRQIPQRQEFLKDKALTERRVAETFGAEGWFQDKTSQGYQMYLAAQADPDVSKRSTAAWIAAVQVHGILDLQKRNAAKGIKTEPATAPTKPRAPASQTASGAGLGPAREPGSTKAVQQLQAELDKLKGKKNVTGRDVEAYLLKMEQARSTR